MATSPQKKYNKIARFLSGNEPAQKPELDSDFQETKKVWLAAGNVTAPEPPSNQWERLYEKMQVRTFAGVRRRYSYFLRIAAAFFIMIISYWAIERLFFAKTVFETQNAETKTITLPDSSIVELNAATIIKYGGSPRHIFIDGEAFFQVKPGEEPFIVKAKDFSVTVLGTAFNVRARQRTSEVAVQHGRVEFKNIESNVSVEINPGEISWITASRAPSVPEQVDVKKYFAWREGEFEFVRTPLSEVFAELERRFDVKVNFLNTQLLRKSLTASFEKGQTVDEILYSVCLTFGLTVEKTKAGFVVR